jgi:Flp pilus assembly protein TadG
MMLRSSTKRSVFGRVWRQCVRLIRRDNGSAIIELAVALPVVLLLVVGVADYARMYYTGITVANAARAAASFGADTAATDAQMVTAAQNDAGTVILDTVSAGRYCVCPGTGVVACTTATCGVYGVPQAYDTVRVRKDYAVLMRYIGLPATVPIVRKVVFRTN